MRSIALIVPVLLAGLAVPRAQAQLTTPTGQTTTGTGTTGTNGTATTPPYGYNIEEVRIGTGEDKVKKKGSTARVTISAEECLQDFDFEFLIVTPRAPIVELWVSRDGTDCSTTTARSSTSTTGVTQCWKVGEIANLNGKDQKFSNVPGRAIFNSKREDVATRKDCLSEGAYDSPYYLWFVTLSVSTVENSTNQTNPLQLPFRIRFNLFTSPPPTPANVKASSGETAIAATWDQGADPLIGYRAYFAVNGMDGGVCGGPLLNDDGGVRNGSAVDVDGISVFESERVAGTRAVLKNLDDKMIETGAQVAVAVGSEDLSGNVGPLSTPQCVPRVKTISAIDACGGTLDECGLETCGLSSASRGSWFGLSLFVLALSALIRRRTA